jgi:hypothetical protein
LNIKALGYEIARSLAGEMLSRAVDRAPDLRRCQTQAPLRGKAPSFASVSVP